MSSAATAPITLSAQEEAIESGKQTLHGGVTDRVVRLFEAIRSYGPPRVTLDRAVLFTESFKQPRTEPMVLRWAKALKLFAERAPIAIFPDELIVGRPNTLARPVGNGLSGAGRQCYARGRGDVPQEQGQAGRGRGHR